jgi:hypothetical protein
MFLNSLHLSVEILDGGASDLQAWHAIKAYRVNISIVPLILNLHTIWKLALHLTHQPLYSQGRTPVSIEQGTVWASELVWTILRTENLSNIQPIASCCTDCFILAPQLKLSGYFMYH